MENIKINKKLSCINSPKKPFKIHRKEQTQQKIHNTHILYIERDNNNCSGRIKNRHQRVRWSKDASLRMVSIRQSFSFITSHGMSVDARTVSHAIPLKSHLEIQERRCCSPGRLSCMPYLSTDVHD